jgi:hypothetical protein
MAAQPNASVNSCSAPAELGSPALLQQWTGAASRDGTYIHPVTLIENT